FFQAEDGIRDDLVTGVQTCALPIFNERGYVQVDELLRTSAPGVLAVGDVAATPLQLAHVAFTEGIAAAERIAGIDVPPIQYANKIGRASCRERVKRSGGTEHVEERR